MSKKGQTMKLSYRYLSKTLASVVTVTACAVISTTMLAACGKNYSDSSARNNGPIIKAVKIRPEFYPTGFEDELQKNLNYFKDGIGVDVATRVPYENISVNDGTISQRFYTNSTVIGMYLNLLVEMEKAGNDNALARIGSVLSQLESAPKWRGLFHWLYDISGTRLLQQENAVVSVVDNGNMSLSLAALVGAYGLSPGAEKRQLAMRADTLLENQKNGWLSLYNSGTGLLAGHWDIPKQNLAEYDIDRKANESRAGALWAVLITSDMGEQALPETVFTNMELYATDVSIGAKSYRPMLTWYGGYFQAMLPAIWLDEARLIPDYSLLRDFTAVQVAHAEQHDIPLVSSSATSDDGYAAFGVPSLSESRIRGNTISGGKTGTPHALALSYLIDPDYAIKRLKYIKERYPAIESEYGWFDALDSDGKISSSLLALDQAMFTQAFFATAIRRDVQTYLDAKGYAPMVKRLYMSFVPDGELPAPASAQNTSITSETGNDDFPPYLEFAAEQGRASYPYPPGLDGYQSQLHLLSLMAAETINGAVIGIRDSVSAECRETLCEVHADIDMTILELNRHSNPVNPNADWQELINRIRHESLGLDLETKSTSMAISADDPTRIRYLTILKRSP